MHPWQAYLRALLYPVLFDARPVDGLQRVIAEVVDSGRSGTPEDFLRAVDAALASKEDLSKILQQEHTDALIREFLVELAKALRARRVRP
jgi:hypothetical protein